MLRLSAERSAIYTSRGEKSASPPRKVFVAESARFVSSLRFDSDHRTEWRIAIRLVDVE